MESERKCTNGEWPCEMSTYVASVEAENNRLEARLKQAEERSYDLSLKFIRERAFILVLGEEIGNHIKGLREVENISQAHPV